MNKKKRLIPLVIIALLAAAAAVNFVRTRAFRSEERRVGKEC